MRKLLVLAVVLCVVAGGGAMYLEYSMDRSAPEIIFSKELVYSEGMSEEDLLEGVTAIDSEDGDVSDSLLIERIVSDTENGAATVIYVAKDSANNIVKVTRLLEAEKSGGETQTEEETEPETELEAVSRKESAETELETGSEEAVEAAETETGETDTDAESDSDETESGAGEASADIAGIRGENGIEETESETESETEETLAAGAPVITLTEERVTITKGSTFEPLDYVATITDDSDNKYTLWRRVQIEGEYDTDTVGVYQLTYYVVDTSGNTSNYEKLQLTVKE